MEDDHKGATGLASAITTAMHHDQAAREVDRKEHPSPYPPKGPVSGGAGGQEFGYFYDFLYNCLTLQRKQEWHDELASTTWSHDNYGTFNAAVSTRSNWATFTYWLIPLLAIEGEPGYNKVKAEGIYRGYFNFLRLLRLRRLQTPPRPKRRKRRRKKRKRIRTTKLRRFIHWCVERGLSEPG